MSRAAAAKHRPPRHREHPEPTREAPVAAGGVPLLGHIPQLRREGVAKLLERLWKVHGDVFRVDLGPRRGLVLSHPDAFERVFASHKANFQKGETYAGVREFLGDGVLTLENEAWRSRRRLLQPHFHRARLQDMFAGMAAMVERYLTGLRARLPEGGVIDMHREMVQLTLDIVMAALFGPATVDLERASHEVLADSLLVMDRRVNGLRLPLWLPTPANRMFKRTLRDLDRAIEGIIAGARAQPQGPTLLAMLLDTVDDESGEALTAKDIRDEVVTLYVAGHETTALLMTWLFVLAGEGGPSSEVFARIVVELDAALGDALPRFEEIGELRYVRQVIDEVLRLRTPVAMLARDTVADDNLLGVRIHAGELALPNFWNLHRHPDFWPDPERFDPERFSPANSEGRDNWSYVPFSAGPRVCIGNTFALTEAALIIAGLFRAARWELLPDQHIQPTIAGTIRPDRPVNVRVRWRE